MGVPVWMLLDGFLRWQWLLEGINAETALSQHVEVVRERAVKMRVLPQKVSSSTLGVK